MGLFEVGILGFDCGDYPLFFKLLVKLQFNFVGVVARTKPCTGVVGDFDRWALLRKHNIAVFYLFFNTRPDLF